MSLTVSQWNEVAKQWVYTKPAELSDVVAWLEEHHGAKSFTVKPNPTPVLDPYTGEPMQDYPYVERGIMDTTATTLNPGTYLAVRIPQ